MWIYTQGSEQTQRKLVNVDTGTQIAIVAISSDGRITGYKIEFPERNNQSVSLGVFPGLQEAVERMAHLAHELKSYDMAQPLPTPGIL